MKKSLVITICIFIAVPTLAFAQIDPLNTGGMKAPESLTSKSGIEQLLVSGVRWVYTIFFIVAVLFVLMAAYNFLQGGKDEKKLALAKNQLKYAAVAIAVALVSTGASLIINSAFK